MELIKKILILSISFLFISCSINFTNIKPSWINDPNANIGVCGFIPSDNFAKQKSIALKKAINNMMLKKGKATGGTKINSNQLYTLSKNKENLNKKFNQNSMIFFTFEDIDYKVKIVDVWKDKETKEVYVRIEEVSL